MTEALWMCIYVHEWVWMWCVYTGVCMYMCTYVTCVDVCMHMQVYVWACMCLYMCVRLCSCVCIFMWVFVVNIWGRPWWSRQFQIQMVWLVPRYVVTCGVLSHGLWTVPETYCGEASRSHLGVREVTAEGANSVQLIRDERMQRPKGRKLIERYLCNNPGKR